MPILTGKKLTLFHMDHISSFIITQLVKPMHHTTTLSLNLANQASLHTYSLRELQRCHVDMWQHKFSRITKANKFH